MPILPSLVWFLLTWIAAGGAAAQTSAGLPGPGCPEPPGGHADAGIMATDLHCVPLLPAAGFPGAAGRALLLPPDTPFGVGVTRDGLPRLRIRVEAEGLPDPEELGPYDHYQGWLTTATFSDMIPLGKLEGGSVETTVDAFNSWLLLISAEGGEPGPFREGPLVLRGASPSMVLRPHDLPLILAEMAAPPDTAPEPGGTHDPGHAHPHADHHTPVPGLHGQVMGTEAQWRMPAMHPQVSMPDAMMSLRPGVRPFLPVGPAQGAEAQEIPPTRPRERVRLAHQDTLQLEAGPVMRRVGHLHLPGFGFNGQSPGPLLEAEEGSTIHIQFRNRTPLPSTIHWHGIRLEAAFDGVPGLTQDPVSPGGDFHYELHLPDEGTFWYHPHLREDVMQDLGLAGNLRVLPAEVSRYPPVSREEFLVLDDVLLDHDGAPVPYGLEAPTHALMGRFGNVLLVNGRTDWELDARPGEVIRFHLTNAASTRTFNLSFRELSMKVVGSDLGRLPRETRVESVVIAPAERWIVDVHFPRGGAVALENRVQALDHVGARFFPEVDTLGAVRVASTPEEGCGRTEGPWEGDASPEEVLRAFETLHRDPVLEEEVARLQNQHQGRPPHHTLILDLRTGNLPFPLGPILALEGVYRPPVEWAGTMPDMDWLVTGREVEWILRDPETGKENMEIDWRFQQGERARLRLVNNRDVLHPMQHPIHLHGQRFLVLSVNGVEMEHAAWKDTVLIPVGAVVDLLVELDNPGPWMLHCHIAEHLETGMMAVIHVDP